MTYDLLLQPLEPGAAYDPAPVDAQLEARKAAANKIGGRVLRLKHGELEVRPLLEGGKVIATEIKVPLSDKLDLVREAVNEAVAIAAEAKLRVFDPQLSKSLSASDEGLVADQFLRTAKYAGEMMGVSEAVNASFPDPDTTGALKPGTKVALGIAAFLVVIWFLANQLLK